MTEEQKRFKISKKEHYNNELSDTKREIVLKTLTVGLFAAAAVTAFLQNVNVNNSSDIYLLNTLTGTINVITTSIQLRKLIKMICRKTVLEGKIEDINNELDMLELQEQQEQEEQEESKGMKR